MGVVVGVFVVLVSCWIVMLSGSRFAAFGATILRHSGQSVVVWNRLPVQAESLRVWMLVPHAVLPRFLWSLSMMMCASGFVAGPPIFWPQFRRRRSVGLRGGVGFIR